MARTRKKALPATTDTQTTDQPAAHEHGADPATEFNPAELERKPVIHPEGIVHAAGESAPTPELPRHADVERAAAHENGHASHHTRHHQHRERANGHIANPSSTRRESHAEAVTRRQAALPSKLTVSAGDMKVQLIDKGDNLAGIGIRVVFPEDRTPTEEEKAIIRKHIKGEDGEHTGFKWDREIGMWAKPIVRENEFEDQVPPSRPVAIRLDAESRVEKLAEALRQHSADPVGYADMVRQRREQAANSDRIPD